MHLQQELPPPLQLPALTLNPKHLQQELPPGRQAPQLVGLSCAAEQVDEEWHGGRVGDRMAGEASTSAWRWRLLQCMMEHLSVGNMTDALLGPRLCK